MKKMVLAFTLTLLLAVTLPTSGIANSDAVAPNGFYNFTTEKFIPLISFTFMTQPEKVAILLADYYLVLGDEAIKSQDILSADTDEELDARKMTVDELKDKFGVEIGGDGSIGSGAVDGDFVVEGIE